MALIGGLAAAFAPPPPPPLSGLAAWQERAVPVVEALSADAAAARWPSLDRDLARAERLALPPEVKRAGAWLVGLHDLSLAAHTEEGRQDLVLAGEAALLRAVAGRN